MAEENIKEETIQPQPTENFPIKNKKSWLMIILITLIIISLGTVSVFAYTNYLLKKQVQTEKDILKTSSSLILTIPQETEISKKNELSQEILNKYPNIIIKNEQIPMIGGNYEEYTKFQYNFEINKDTKVSVRTDPNTKRYDPGRGISINDKGNIFLESQGEEKVLIKDINLLDEGGESVYVYSTNVNNIYIITTAWERNFYYLDLNKKEVDNLVIENDDGRKEWNNKITLTKNRYENVIEVKVIDKCDLEVEQEEKEAQIVDITINDKNTGVLKNPIAITCSVGLWGMGDTWVKKYNPDISLETIGIENDYSKFYFKFKLLNHNPQGNEPKIVLEKNFYINISDFNNPQILE